jgi:predicted transcriptional regulator
MKKIEIVITTPAQAVDAFKKTWRRAEAGETVTPMLGFGSPAELYSAITDKRLELLRYVAQHEDEALNMHQLAQALGRDYKNVHVDVKALEALGLIERTAGKLIAPFDEIEIHLGLRKAA